MHYEMWDKITYPFPNFNGAVISSHTLLGIWLLIHAAALKYNNRNVKVQSDFQNYKCLPLCFIEK